MKKYSFILLAIAGLGLSFSCGNSDKPPFETKKQSPNDTKENKTSSLSGGELYSQKCTDCGNLGIGGAKKISESTLSQVEREELISNGKKTMPAFKDQISSEEIKKIAEYTLTMK